MIFSEAVQEYAEGPLTRQLMLDLLKDYRRPNDKINELVKKGELTTVRRGLYVPGPRLKIGRPSNFLVANHLCGPSYISLESALSYWGLIPERVYETSSVTVKTGRRYETPIGRFSYTHAPLPYYAFGIRSVALTERQAVMIASPEKALCDMVTATAGVFLRSIRQTRDYLFDDLRLDEEALHSFDLAAMNSWVPDAPKSSSISMLVKTLRYL
ncbi:MAG: hypothetical protein QM664_04820 [Flavihumibacter sp.]